MPVFENTQIIDNQEVTIAIEVDNLPGAPETYYTDLRDSKQVLETIHDLFGAGMVLARNTATRAVASIRQMSEASKPDEFELQFSIKLDAEVGAVIAKTSTEAQLQVKMTWKAKDIK